MGMGIAGDEVTQTPWRFRMCPEPLEGPSCPLHSCSDQSLGIEGEGPSTSHSFLLPSILAGVVEPAEHESPPHLCTAWNLDLQASTPVLITYTLPGGLPWTPSS